MKLFKIVRLYVYVPIFILAISLPALAQVNVTTFDNQSGEHALVKVIGPSQETVEVPTGTKSSVKLKAGKYYIKVRYGESGKYTYTQGEEFEIKDTQGTRSVITITLHKVANGNYGMHNINVKDFDIQPPKTSAKNAQEKSSAQSPQKGYSHVIKVVDGSSLNAVPIDGSTMSFTTSPNNLPKLKKEDWDNLRKWMQEKTAETRCAVLPLDFEKHTAMLGNGTTLSVINSKYLANGHYIFSQNSEVDNKVVLRLDGFNFNILHLQQDSDRIVLDNNDVRIGVGSELRFPDSTWVEFLNSSYQKGGLKIGENSIIYFPGTQRKIDGKIEVFIDNKWVEKK